MLSMKKKRRPMQRYRRLPTPCELYVPSLPLGFLQV